MPDPTPVPDRPDDEAMPAAIWLCPVHTEEFYVPHGGPCPEVGCEAELIRYERFRSGPDSATQGDDHEAGIKAAVKALVGAADEADHDYAAGWPADMAHAAVDAYLARVAPSPPSATEPDTAKLRSATTRSSPSLDWD